MNSNQGSKTRGFHHRLVLGSLKSLPWNCQRVPPLPVLSDRVPGAMKDSGAPCCSSSIRTEGEICWFHELQKTLKSYLITPVINYHVNFTCCFKPTFQILFWCDPMWDINWRDMKLTFQMKIQGRITFHCPTGNQMQTKRRKCSHFVQTLINTASL